MPRLKILFTSYTGVYIFDNRYSLTTDQEVEGSNPSECTLSISQLPEFVEQTISGIDKI